jgi:hypothetical protein
MMRRIQPRGARRAAVVLQRAAVARTDLSGSAGENRPHSPRERSISSRVMANDLGTVLGKQFSSRIAAARQYARLRDVAHSDPDGYTLLMSSASAGTVAADLQGSATTR